MKSYNIFILLSILTVIIFNSSCNVNRAYVNGQEGLETVYAKDQWIAQADFFGSGGTSGLHADAGYSPIKNIAVLYDTKMIGTQLQQHSLAAGVYLSDYTKFELSRPSVSKEFIDIGRHLDFYAGATYNFANNIFIELPFFSGGFPGTISPTQQFFEINYTGKRYFVQAGGHVKSKYLAFDATLRRLWLDPSQIETFGVGPNIDIDPVGDFAEKGFIGYTEFAFKMNFGGHYKPFYIGFSSRFGKETNFTNYILSPQIVFFGANVNLYHLFTKRAAAKKQVDYIYEEE
jgi:hypothetical protein